MKSNHSLLPTFLPFVDLPKVSTANFLLLSEQPLWVQLLVLLVAARRRTSLLLFILDLRARKTSRGHTLTPVTAMSKQQIYLSLFVVDMRLEVFHIQYSL